MDELELMVTCPNCQHSHVEKVDLHLLEENPASERMYRLAELETILGLSRRTLKQLIYDRKLKAVKLTSGKVAAWQVSEGEVNRFKRERQQEGR